MSDSLELDQLANVYEDESSEMEDEDELNRRIQQKSNESTESQNRVDIEKLHRSQTDPPGDLSQFEHDYKGGKHKNIKKKKAANIPSKPEHNISKSKSVQSDIDSPSNHKHSSPIEDEDEDDDEDEASGHDHEEQNNITHQIITEDEEYTGDGHDHQSTPQQIPAKSKKRGSTMNMVKNGIRSAKKRFASNSNGSGNPQSNGANKGSPSSSSNTDSQSTPPASSSASHTKEAERKKRGASDSLTSNRRTSFNILSKGKGLFNRSASKQSVEKETAYSTDDDPTDSSNKKSNLSSIKLKLQSMKNSYSKSNKTPPTQPSSKEQERDGNKPQKKKKKSSKKREKKMESKRNEESESKSRQRSTSTAPTTVSSTASRSPSKNRKEGKRGTKQPHGQRHSMQPVRSRSLRPNKKARQSTNNIADKKSATNRHRIQSDVKRDNDLKLRKKSYSEYGKGSVQSQKTKPDKYDNFTSRDSMRQKSQSKLGRNLSTQAQNKVRRKSGGPEHDSYKETNWKPKVRRMPHMGNKSAFRVKNEIFELYDYYKPVRLLGQGAYAVVAMAIDQRTKRRVAVKKNKNVFDDIRDSKRILREIKLLLHFSRYKHPDVVEVYDTLPPLRSDIDTYRDVYIVMPMFETSLYKIIEKKEQTLGHLHFQYIVYQILRGLTFIHSSGVIHRDIKPENILVNGQDCDVKIIDFGLARGVVDAEEDPNNAKITEYVCTRWYRAPEIMCSAGYYDEKMDIWGAGCILGEMILRRPLFPGANYLHQLQTIFDKCGTPRDTEWILNDQARSWVKKLDTHDGRDWAQMMAHKFGDTEEDLEHLENVADLLQRLLALNPADRISAEEAMYHPYFARVYEEGDVMKCDKFDLSFEFQKSIKTKFGVRHMMYDTLASNHLKQWKRHKAKMEKKRLKQEKMEKAKSAEDNDTEEKKKRDKSKRDKEKRERSENSEPSSKQKSSKTRSSKSHKSSKHK